MPLPESLYSSVHCPSGGTLPLLLPRPQLLPPPLLLLPPLLPLPPPPLLPPCQSKTAFAESPTQRIQLTIGCVIILQRNTARGMAFEAGAVAKNKG